MQPKTQRGFTLVELAIVLLILSVLAGGVVLTVRAQLSQRQLAETRAALDQARAALMAFAAVNGRLPCPAVGGAPGQGSEPAINAGGCTNIRGLLPWETLGVVAIDGWGRRLGYAVSKEFSTAFTLDTTGSVEVAAGQGGPDKLATSGSVAAAIWSYGPNGLYATQPNGNTIPGMGAGNDECVNGTGSVCGGGSNTSTVIAREEWPNPTTPGGAFDDRVIWISRFVLFDRMLAAGKLP